MPSDQQRIGRLLAALSDADGDEKNLLMDEVVRALRVAAYYWDPVGMVPIKAQQGATEADVQDQLFNYKIDDFDVASNPVYIGYQTKDGAYFIRRVNTSTGAVDYTAGPSGYSAAWTNRAGEAYADFAGTF